MSEWKKMKLSECCLSIADGDHQPPPKAEAGIPFVTIANMTSTNQFDFSDTSFVPQEYYDGLDDKRKAKKNDILYSVVGSFGIPVFMKEDKEFVFQRHIAILRPDCDVIVPRFLFYTMLTRDFYAMADAAALGAAQRTVSLTSLRNMEISIPDKAVQEHIVQVLSAYDDLIENNQRQIKLLEEVAQRQYKEWFVDLRFPGYDNAEIIDGVPSGWKQTTLEKICTISKKVIQASDIVSGTPYIGLEHMPRRDFCLSEWGDSSEINSSKFEYKENDILFGKIRPYFHKVGFAINDGYASTDSIIMRAKDGLWGLLLMLTSSDEFVDYTYQTCKEGSKMPRADWNQMKIYPVLIADEVLQKSFENNCRVIADKIKALAYQTRMLVEARERLLPKLMSGEIEL